MQLPAWNEALGLPRPFDQQWSLRLQQIMAYETDLLEFGDLFDGSKEIAALVETLKAEAQAEIAAIDAMGGAVQAIETGALKAQLVESNTRRLEAIERGEQIVVGVNAFTNSEPSPLTAGENSIMVPSAEAEAEQIASLKAWRAGRDPKRVSARRCRALRTAAASGANIMPASIEAAKAGVTTGEWGDALRAEFGEFRAPTGVSPKARQESADLDALRGEVERVSLKLGRGSSSSSASPASTAIPTAPSRSPPARSMREWTSSTTASASRRPRSSSAPRRASIASACRSCPARMSR